MSAAIIKTEASQKRRNFISKFLIYFFLIVITACMLLPFLWMLSSSFKLNKDVFGFPIQWIPKNPRWQNYVDIWTQIPLLTFVKNTVKITVVVTLLQLFTSSFAAYAFAKMQFKGKNALFLGYIATIAVPWQAYMVPQFMMMSSWHLNNTHLAIMCLQAFSAFGVFLMKQFYEGVPTELCEAARIDGLSEYGIWWHIMLPLSLPALSTLTIFTFVNTWNDFLGPLIYLTKTELKTIQIGLRMFITQYSAEYGLIMAASVVALIPVLIVFLSLQKYFVQGVASTGKFEVLLGQLVNLLRNGKPVRMSKRKGTMVTLQELVDEVGSDAARYTLISKSSNQMVDFDIEAVKKRDNSNPVYYVQYAHARVCSILRRAADVTPEQADEMGMKAVAAKAIGENVDYSLLTDPTELALSRKLNELTDLIASCARDRAPFRLTHFAEELAGDFHSFYAACQVLPSEGRPVDPELSRARLAACDAVRVTLALVLTLVGVSAPEQM